MIIVNKDISCFESFCDLRHFFSDLSRSKSSNVYLHGNNYDFSVDNTDDTAENTVLVK